MIDLEFERPVNLAKLHDELIAACPGAFIGEEEGIRISVGFVLARDPEGVTLRVPDGADVAKITETVKLHDPTPLPAPAGTLEDRLVSALEALPPDRVVSASELITIIRGS